MQSLYNQQFSQYFLRSILYKFQPRFCSMFFDKNLKKTLRNTIPRFEWFFFYYLDELFSKSSTIFSRVQKLFQWYVFIKDDFITYPSFIRGYSRLFFRNSSRIYVSETNPCHFFILLLLLSFYFSGYIPKKKLSKLTWEYFKILLDEFLKKS